MAANLQKVLRAIKAHAKTSHAWTRGQPTVQPYFIFRDESWTAENAFISVKSADIVRLTILSWNIDFMRILTRERMTCALKYLNTHISQNTAPTVVMLSEMLESDLELIRAEKWVQQGYNLTDIDNEYWESGYYGTCVLVPKDLPISNIFRVHYTDTAMERDALFIDLKLNQKTVRLCSTHLESLVANPPKRPNQLAEAARHMHDADASILGGDLNAIQPFDKTLHINNNLKDAYLETGGEEDANTGMTWGQMAPTSQRNQFGLSRMDKLLFCGNVKVESFALFGMDLQVDEDALREQLVKEEGLEKGWVTDHLGIRGEFRFLTSPSL